MLQPPSGRGAATLDRRSITHGRLGTTPGASWSRHRVTTVNDAACPNIQVSGPLCIQLTVVGDEQQGRVHRRDHLGGLLSEYQR